jgi:zinc protease
MKSLSTKLFCLFTLITFLSASGILKAAETEKFTLDNGLTVLLRKESSAPILTMQMWVRTGSITEDKLLGSGMSHFVEHMLFKGTQKRKVGDYAKEVASYGGRLNAYTTYDRTVYYFTISSSYFDEGLDAISDVLKNAAFPEDEAIKEQEVIRREIAMNDDSPGRQQWQTVVETAYLRHPYRLPICGFLPTYNALTRDDLVEYYRNRYIPNNSIFVVAGDFEPSEARPKIEAAFADWQRKALKPAFYEVEPDQVTPRYVERELAIEKMKVEAVWQGQSLSSPDIYAGDVLSIIAGVGDRSRLHQRLVEKDQLVTSAGCHNWTPLDRGLFMAFFELDDKNLNKALAALDEEIEKLRTELVTEEELARAKAMVLAAAVKKLETIEGIADSIGSGEFDMGNTDYSTYYVERIRKVTAEDVRAAAGKYLIPSTKTTVVFRPKGKKSSLTEADKNKLLADLRSRRGKGPDKTSIPSVKVITLSNGLKVLIEERPRLPIASVAVSFPGGTKYEKGYRSGTSALMAEMLVKGTKKRSAEEIAELVEGLGADLTVEANTELYGLRSTFLKEDLGTILDILADVLINSDFKNSEIEKLRIRQLAAIATERDRPFSDATLDFASLRFGKHPWGRSKLGTEEDVRALTRDEMIDYYKATCTPDNAVLSIVGDVKTDLVVKLLEEKLSRWTSGEVKLTGEKVPALLQTIEKHFPRAHRKQSFILFGFEGCAQDNDDQYALEVLNNAIGGMGNRLFRNLRGKKSLAYQIGCFHSVGSEKKTQLFYIVTTPERTKEAIDALKAEIQGVIDEGITPEEFERAKNQTLGALAIDLQTNSSIAATMAYHEIMNLGWDFPFLQPEKVRKVTIEDISRVAKKYWTLDRHILAVVGPEVK